MIFIGHISTVVVSVTEVVCVNTSVGIRTLAVSWTALVVVCEYHTTTASVAIVMRRTATASAGLVTSKSNALQPTAAITRRHS